MLTKLTHFHTPSNGDLDWNTNPINRRLRLTRLAPAGSVRSFALWVLRGAPRGLSNAYWEVRNPLTIWWTAGGSVKVTRSVTQKCEKWASHYNKCFSLCSYPCSWLGTGPSLRGTTNKLSGSHTSWSRLHTWPPKSAWLNVLTSLLLRSWPRNKTVIVGRPATWTSAWVIPVIYIFWQVFQLQVVYYQCRYTQQTPFPSYLF